MSYADDPEVARVDPLAYNALAHALAAIYWYKDPFHRFLRVALREVPEILAQVDFGVTAGNGLAVGGTVDGGRGPYRDVSIELMLIVARLETFPDLARHEDAERLTAQCHGL